MGQQQSTQGVSIQLEVEHNQLLPGDVISGVVRAHVSRAIVSNGVLITVRCVAHTMKRSSDDGNAYQDQDAFPPFSVALTPLGHADVAPGSYELRFDAPLPASAPPTVAIKGPGCEASVSYKLECAMLDANGRVAASTGYSLAVGRAVPPTGPLEMRGEQLVTAWCCFSRGAFAIEAVLNKSAFSLAAEGSVTLRLENNSALPATGVKVALEEDFIVRARHRSASWSNVRAAGEAPLQLAPGETLKEPVEVAFAGYFVKPSVELPTIVVRHFVRVSLRVPGATFAPTVRIPVTVGYAPDGGVVTALVLEEPAADVLTTAQIADSK